MANLEFIETTIPLQAKKEVTCEKTLSAGEFLKAEVGGDELNKTVPMGKQWVVVLNIRLIETDV